LQLIGTDAVVADRGDRRIGRSGAEDIADPPDPEGQDQQDEQQLDDEGSRLERIAWSMEAVGLYLRVRAG
jgi:hypothetical protein